LFVAELIHYSGFGCFPVVASTKPRNRLRFPMSERPQARSLAVLVLMTTWAVLRDDAGQKASQPCPHGYAPASRNPQRTAYAFCTKHRPGYRTCVRHATGIADKLLILFVEEKKNPAGGKRGSPTDGGGEGRLHRLSDD